MTREKPSALGHVISNSGGINRMDNCPINIHIHIHANELALGQKIGRHVCEYFNKRRDLHIEGAASLSEEQLHGQLNRAYENR